LSGLVGGVLVDTRAFLGEDALVVLQEVARGTHAAGHQAVNARVIRDEAKTGTSRLAAGASLGVDESWRAARWWTNVSIAPLNANLDDFVAGGGISFEDGTSRCLQLSLITVSGQKATDFIPTLGV
jgi:hypothetical protein